MILRAGIGFPILAAVSFAAFDVLVKARLEEMNDPSFASMLTLGGGFGGWVLLAGVVPGIRRSVRFGPNVGWIAAGGAFFALASLGITLFRQGKLGEANSYYQESLSLNREMAPKVVAYGAATGTFSGFFGIGGGFLIVPGLIASTGMPMINAVGSSLVAVTAFGLTTALNYALSGLIDWLLALAFILGGLVGGYAGARLARHLSAARGRLSIVFAALIFAVAGYMLWKSAAAW